MNISYYVIPGACGLKFDSNPDREEFWNSLGKLNRNGFCPQAASERVGQRTIRFYPAKMKQGFEWLFQTRNGAAPVVAPVAVVANPPPAQATPPPAPPKPQDTVTLDPFAHTSPNPTR